jgi:hypothetical protein
MAILLGLADLSHKMVGFITKLKQEALGTTRTSPHAERIKNTILSATLIMGLQDMHSATVIGIYRMRLGSLMALEAKGRRDGGQAPANRPTMIGRETTTGLGWAFNMRNSIRSVRVLAHAISLTLKMIFKVKVAMSFGVLVLFFWFGSGCSPGNWAWHYSESKRITSPDHEVQAVILTGDAGATTANATFVVIVSTNQVVDTENFQQSDAVFKADHLKGFHVFWKEPHLLVIQYDEARISSFNNLWDVLNHRQYAYPVEIRLAPTSKDFSVPPEDRQPFLVK